MLNKKDRMVMLGLVFTVLLILLLFPVYRKPGASTLLVSTCLLMGFGALVHAVVILGWRRAITFFSIVMGVVFLGEAFHQNAGSGDVCLYTGALGPRLLGVPMLAPLGFFSLLYISHTTTNFLVENQPVSNRGGNGWLLMMAFLTAMVMTAFDLLVDPILVQHAGAWQWARNGAYLGIPFSNLLKWLEFAFICDLSYRLLEREKKVLVLGSDSPLLVGLPLLMQLALGLGALKIGTPTPIRVLVPFLLGISAMGALGSLFRWKGQRSGCRPSGHCFEKNLTLRTDLLDAAGAVKPALAVLLVTAILLLLAAQITLLGYEVALGHFPFSAMTYVFSALVFVHAVTLVGWRQALAFFWVAVITAFVMEHLGLKTGVIFGRYAYTDVLGPKVFGSVPLPIMLAYFMVIWPCHMLANLLLRGKAIARFGRISWRIWASLLTALIMTAWDLVLDPVMVRDGQAWVWLDGGAYFGIPFRNFVGWVLTTFIISLLCRSLEMRIPRRPLGNAHRWVVMLPIIGYACLCIGAFFLGTPDDTKAIAPFAMGIPLLAGVMVLFRPNWRPCPIAHLHIRSMAGEPRRHERTDHAAHGRELHGARLQRHIPRAVPGSQADALTPKCGQG